MKSLRLLTLAPLTILSLSANAAGNNYFYAGAGNVGFDIKGAEDNKIYDNPSFTIGGGQYLSEHFSIEGFYRYSNATDSASTYEVDAHQLGLSFIATTGPLGDTPLELFARGTGAYTIVKGKDITDGDRKSVGDDSTTGLNIGGGLQWNMNADFWLRAEYIYNVVMSDINDFDTPDYSGAQITIGKRF
ncbi:outer membrane beta-barrel protein [Vibrio rumoiensis]|uniref:Outer membrane protein beta-barrel domain-containing protein n=1 Tax=Vibrio rumoiensis 1S-45 TaxID=1188252 RepID=A0A1E5E2F6_9VIBR|nr:outer membrane beta-barrel protein [Vibrio rumoiensis]OEF25660.1 hypothetical protein A1QC_08495 [Vibrio rumoiensis 1S-45]